MSSPVSSNTTGSFFDDEFEDIKKTMKEEGQATLEKTSSQAKDFMKGQVDACAKTATPYITSPCKVAVTATSPQSIASTVNVGITYCVEPVIEASLKKVGHKSVDKCVDLKAKEIMNKSIDSSVDSTQSLFGMIYSYVQSKFYK